MKLRFVKSLLIGLCTLLGMNSCSAKSEETNKETKTEMKTDGKKLVVFFSHTGENYNVGNIEKGNTHIIADMIADATGADIFEIVPEKGYPEDSYDECIEIAKKELQSDARPAVKGDINIEDYDVVFIGYPNWWGNPPMCVYTFIENHDWDDKTVIPFITHEGSGMGGTDRKIAEACEGSNTLTGKGLAVQGKVAQENRDSAQKNVDNWLNGLGFKTSCSRH
ncbi:MAG: flavodoxin [Muribaculaceae bacterium]|nr:flavodoxin [Muribaculaceae bacterium]